jgi:membrane protease YdiL (CAAX protease family)
MRPAATAFIAVAVVVTAIAAYFAFLPESAGTIAFWVFAVGPTLVLGGFAAAWAKREELLTEWLSPKWGDFTRGVVGAVLLFCVAWAFVRLVAPLGSAREIWLVSLYGEIGDPRQLQAHAPALAATIGAAAIAEEVLWRGAVTQLLAERVGSRMAWVWAAGLYALAYVPTAWSLRAVAGQGGGLNPLLPIGALGAGLVWGGMARAFGRLAPSVLAHALFDWAVVAMFPLWGVR